MNQVIKFVIMLLHCHMSHWIELNSIGWTCDVRDLFNIITSPNVMCRDVAVQTLWGLYFKGFPLIFGIVF